MKVTIGKVARHAGVSISTVSRVLNSPQLVNAQTRERVLEAISELGFEPNLYARSIGGYQSITIGMVVPGIRHFYFNELYSGIDKAAVDRDVSVLLYNAGPTGEESLQGFSVLKARQCDGIIYTSGSIDSEASQWIHRLGIPVVLTLTGGPDTALPAFKVDDLAAAFDAVAHLVTRGHRKIAMISGPLEAKISGQLRFNGYKSALAHYEIPYEEELVEYGGFRFEDGYQAMGRLLERHAESPFTAVFSAGDEMALGAMRRIQEAGLSVPNDLSIVGFDNLSISKMVTPQLTTVAQPFERIGEEAVDYLVNVIQKRQVYEPGVHYIRHQFISRESVKSLYP